MSESNRWRRDDQRRVSVPPFSSDIPADAWVGEGGSCEPKRERERRKYVIGSRGLQATSFSFAFSLL